MVYRWLTADADAIGVVVTEHETPYSPFRIPMEVKSLTQEDILFMERFPSPRHLLQIIQTVVDSHFHNLPKAEWTNPACEHNWQLRHILDQLAFVAQQLAVTANISNSTDLG